MLQYQTIEPGTLQLLKLYMQKYPDGSLFIAMKSLSYFEDAESDPMPFMFEDTDWDDVKARIREAVIQLGLSIFFKTG